MFRSLWGKFFILLLAISVIGLSGSFYLRSMMLRDFGSFIDGQQLDHLYIVIAELEGNWELNSGWDETSLADITAQALMLGMEIRVQNEDGTVLMDMDQALDRLKPLMKRRVLSLTAGAGTQPGGDFIPFPLFLGGENIGVMEVRFRAQDKSGFFIRRSHKFLALSFMIMGGIAVLASLVASSRLTRPIKELLRHTEAIRRGDFEQRTNVRGTDEIAELSLAFNEMAQDLQMQDSLRRKLIANVAHELRTPIAAMKGELEAMIDGVIPTTGDQVKSLYEEINRLGTILDGIDDLTQAQSSSLNIVRQDVNVITVLENIRDRFEAIATEKGIRVVLEGSRSIQAWADADKVSQILVNLVGNAVRHTLPGGVVTLGATEEQGGTVVEIADTGSGISEEDLPHIFERFFKGEGGGLGLGLSIVKELVDAHKGKIEVESEEGKGTRIRIFLPGKEKGTSGKWKVEGLTTDG